MSYELSPDIVKKAKKCKKGLQCLKNEKPNFCPAISNIGGEVLTLTRNSCSYKMSFGNSFICNCPVRKALNNKYGI